MASARISRFGSLSILGLGAAASVELTGLVLDAPWARLAGPWMAYFFAGLFLAGAIGFLTRTTSGWMIGVVASTGVLIRGFVLLVGQGRTIDSEGFAFVNGSPLGWLHIALGVALVALLATTTVMLRPGRVRAPFARS